MQIGLVRHFKVDLESRKVMTSQEYLDWGLAYDEAGVIPNPVDSKGINWDICYVSDLSRALVTAKAIYEGNLIVTKELREVRNYPFFKSQFKWFHAFWSICGRTLWFFSHPSQLEGKKDTVKRVNDFLDTVDLENDLNILIVSHGFFMMTLRKALLKRGFKGPSFGIAKNGQLYMFEKPGAGRAGRVGKEGKEGKDLETG